MKSVCKNSSLRVIAVILLTALSLRTTAQDLKFAIHADPVISWMGSNEAVYQGEGVKAGLNIGLNVLHFFADNYAISTGISYLTTGGRQSVTETHTMVFNNFQRTVNPGDEIRYDLRYINIPLGIRLQTNKAGYHSYFTDLGLDLRILLRSTVDIPAMQISRENARNEVYGLNAGWHLGGGIEYELGTDASVIAGIAYAQDFFDITKDLQDVNQPDDRACLRMFSIRLGIKF